MLHSKGHLEVLKWAHENGCDGIIIHVAMLRAEAIQKYLNGLAKMVVHGMSGTCSAAARGGHLEILKWIRENGCPWMDLHAVMLHMEVIQKY